MREIKVRAWAQNAEVMVYQKDFFKFIDGGMMELAFEDDKIIGFYQMHENYGEEMSLGNPPLYSTDDMVKVMQYTGLKDKNGREIYEGDILTDYGDEGPLYIEYSKEHAAFVFVDKFDSFGTTLYTTTEISYEGFEVIGNIYENPELLEVVG